MSIFKSTVSRLIVSAMARRMKTSIVSPVRSVCAFTRSASSGCCYSRKIAHGALWRVLRGNGAIYGGVYKAVHALALRRCAFPYRVLASSRHRYGYPVKVCRVPFPGALLLRLAVFALCHWLLLSSGGALFCCPFRSCPSIIDRTFNIYLTSRKWRKTSTY